MISLLVDSLLETKPTRLSEAVEPGTKNVTFDHDGNVSFLIAGTVVFGEPVHSSFEIEETDVLLAPAF